MNEWDKDSVSQIYPKFQSIYSSKIEQLPVVGI